MNDNLHQLRCFGCGARISGPEARPDFRCAACGDLFEVEYPGWAKRGGPDRPNPGALKWLWRERRMSAETLDHSGVWRFRELLPFLNNFGNAVTLREGNTPLYPLLRAAKTLGIDQLYAKHQGMNPTGSFKDTGMTAAISVARERGFEWVACASTGNTSAAMAAYAARAGLRSLVLIPEGKTSWGKLSQAMDYGAVTCPVGNGLRRLPAPAHGNRPRSADLSAQLRQSLSPGGPEDAGLRDCRSLRLECPPTTSSFRRQSRQQFRARQGLPRVEGAGPRGAPSAHHGGAGGRGESLGANARQGAGATLEPVEAHTHATAIRIGNPASWRKAAKVIEETSGWCIDVTEAEIAIAKAELGAEGLGCEPASAVTLAGLKKLRAKSFIGSSDTVVLLLTGHTLKDADYTIDFHRGTLLSEEEKAGASEQVKNSTHCAATPFPSMPLPPPVLAAMKDAGV